MVFRNASGSGWLWLAISVGLLLIASLRASETEILLGSDLRRIIMELGWYPHRRPVQIAAILAFSLVIVAGLRSILLNRKMLKRQEVFATCAFAAIVVFAAVRSSSLHWTDEALEFRLGTITLGKLVQWSGLAVIAISAASILAQPFMRRIQLPQAMKDLRRPNSND